MKFWHFYESLKYEYGLLWWLTLASCFMWMVLYVVIFFPDFSYTGDEAIYSREIVSFIYCALFGYANGVTCRKIHESFDWKERE